MLPGVIMQPTAWITGNEAMQIYLVSQRQSQQVVTLEVGLVVGPVDDAAATISRQSIQYIF